MPPVASRPTTTTPAAELTSSHRPGHEAQKWWRSWTRYTFAYPVSTRVTNTSVWSCGTEKPRASRPIQKITAVSNNQAVATPSPTAVMARTSQRSGRGDGRTRSAASDMVTKSLANSSSRISDGVVTNSPVRINPPAKEQRDLERLGDLVQGVRQHPLVDLATDFDRVHNSTQPRTGQHHPGGLLRDIDRTGHRDPDLRLPQGRRIVHPVPGHPGHPPGLLERLDQPELIVRIHASEHVAIEGQIVARVQRTRRGDRPGDADLGGDRPGRGRPSPVTITTRTPNPQLSDDLGRVLARRVVQGDETEQRQRVIRPGGNGQHPAPLAGERFDLGAQIGRVLHQSRHRRRCPLHDADAAVLPANDRFGPLRGRVEGGECDSLLVVTRQPAPADPGQDGEVERVLSGLVARAGRRPEQFVRLVRGHGEQIGEQQPVLGEGSGFVTTQYFDRRRLLDRGQARDQHPGG